MSRVLTAAMRIADESGLGALTMRRLAGELGVEAMSLYHYVAKKDDILDGLVDRVLEEMEPPSDAMGWRAGIRASAISAHEALGRHPWACNLLMSPSSLRPGRMRFMDGMLGSLRRAGFSPDVVEKGYHALDGHIFGSTLWSMGIAQGAAGYDDLAGSVLRTVPLERYPDLADHIRQHMAPPRDGGQSTFDFSLDLILDGLERLAEG